LAVIEACCEPDASVAGIAMANGVNANQVRRSMRERGIEAPTRRVAMPVIEAAPAMAPALPPAFIPLPIPPATPASCDIRIEVRRGNTAIKVDWPVQACRSWSDASAVPDHCA